MKRIDGGIREEKFLRNSLNKKDQEKIRKTCFVIAGLGGTGGFAFENLLRLGAERFVLFDNDRFELTNFNRQILATDLTLDQPKTTAAIDRAKIINQRVSIESLGAFKLYRLYSIPAMADIVIDCTDNIVTKIAVAKAARMQKIPYIFCSANDSRGIITIFYRYSFERAFNLSKTKDALKKYTVCSRILCPAAAIAGTLAAMQAVNYILKRRQSCVLAPEALFFDLLKANIFWKTKLG